MVLPSEQMVTRLTRSGSPELKSRSGQFRCSVANSSQPLLRIFEKSCVVQAQWRGDGPSKFVTRFAVIKASPNIMKDLNFDVIGLHIVFSSCVIFFILSLSSIRNTRIIMP